MLHYRHFRFHFHGRRLSRKAEALKLSRNRWQHRAVALKNAMALYETIFENTGTATILIDEDFTISAINDGFARLIGLSPEAIEGRIHWTTFIHRDDLPRMKQYHRMRRQAPNAAPRNYEFRILSRTQGTREVAITIDMVPGTAQSIASMMDVTDTRRLEREIIAAGERERRRIGRDLHDDLGSHLSGVELLSKVLQTKVAQCSPEIFKEVETIRTLISEAIEKTRRLSQGLYPVHVVEDGLETALESLATEIEQIFGIPVELVFDPAVERLGHTAATHLFYIVHEAMYNAARHGGPTAITINVSVEKNRFSVNVHDNGCWQPAPHAPAGQGGLGLHTMAFRARAMGALLSIDGNEKGTCVALCGRLPEHAFEKKPSKNS
ncbi:putative two component system sensor histidine kinase [Desulfosarcina variabilis str. Montpellier]|uniref:sensor histidine kinase n=1 Tax=Desulfosarcina variabilis TaxID=2300 RepID=UPI003AFB1626